MNTRSHIDSDSTPDPVERLLPERRGQAEESLANAASDLFSEIKTYRHNRTEGRDEDEELGVAEHESALQSYADFLSHLQDLEQRFVGPWAFIPQRRYRAEAALALIRHLAPLTPDEQQWVVGHYRQTCVLPAAHEQVAFIERLRQAGGQPTIDRFRSWLHLPRLDAASDHPASGHPDLFGRSCEELANAVYDTTEGSTA
jgi:hypothetical protein